MGQIVGKSSTSYTQSELSWKAIWNAKVPERIKEFTWKIKHNAIATRGNLALKRIATDSICPICEKAEETLEHLFLLCPWTSPCVVWSAGLFCA